MNQGRPKGQGFPCTVQGMRERGIFSFSKENSSFFAQVRMSMRHKCRVMRPPFSFPRKKTGVARPKERRSPLQASSSKSCNACRIGCLPSSVSKRLDYLLSSLSLCLQFATLTQSPSTLDLCRFASACQGSIVGACRDMRTFDSRRLHRTETRFESGSG